MTKIRYAVQYQLSDCPIRPYHRTRAAAEAHAERCRRAARKGGDCQGVGVVEVNP